MLRLERKFPLEVVLLTQVHTMYQYVIIVTKSVYFFKHGKCIQRIAMRVKSPMYTHQVDREGV